MLKSRNLVLFTVFVLVILSFLTTQLTNDFFVFWAYGRSVYNSSLSGIDALIETWELKGLLFKFYVYIEYALTSLLSTSFDSRCQTIYKLIGLIPYLAILAYSVYTIPQKYIGEKVYKLSLFQLLAILLLAVHFCSHFQPEMWGVAFLLLSFSFYLRDGLKSKVIAAFFFTLTFYLKSPIPLLGGSLVIASFMLKKQTNKDACKDIVPFALFSALFLGASLFLLYIFYPQEIEDIRDASYFQHTLLSSPSQLRHSLHKLVTTSFKNILYHPVVMMGVISYFLLVFRFLVNRKCLDIFSLTFIWFFPLLYVLISNCFFGYHFYLLSFSSLLTLLISANIHFKLNRKLLFGASTVFFLYYTFVLSSVCPINLYQKRMYADYMKMNETKQHITPGIKLGNGSIMFLDGGYGSFYFSNKSYLRYFYPLPLQRTRTKDKFYQMPLYREVKQKALSYTGEYITLNQEWFSRGSNDDILDKIEKEYTLYKKVVSFSYSWVLFRKVLTKNELMVYRRK